MPEYYGYVYQVYNNLNNKFYIGQHAKSEFDKNYYGSGVHIKRAVKKYGKENFTLSDVYWAKDKDELNRMEEFVVGAYLGNPKCYNIGSGGGCPTKGLGMSKEAKEKIRQSKIGRYVTDEEKRRHSISMKKVYKERPELLKQISERSKGVKRTKEQCENMSRNQKGKKKTYKTGLSHSCKKVLCVETGIIYGSVRLASNKTGVHHAGIGNAAIGYAKKAGGYHWKYI